MRITVRRTIDPLHRRAPARLALCRGGLACHKALIYGLRDLLKGSHCSLPGQTWYFSRFPKRTTFTLSAYGKLKTFPHAGHLTFMLITSDFETLRHVQAHGNNRMSKAEKGTCDSAFSRPDQSQPLPIALGVFGACLITPCRRADLRQ